MFVFWQKVTDRTQSMDLEMAADNSISRASPQSVSHGENRKAILLLVRSYE